MVLRSIPDQQIHWGAWVVASGDFELMSWVDGEGVGRVWDVKSGEATVELPPCYLPLALSDDGSMLIAAVGCTSATSLSLIDTVTGAELLPLGEGDVETALFTSGGTDDPNRFAVVTRNGTTEIFDLVIQQRVAVIDPPEGDFLYSIAVDAEGRNLAIGSDYSGAYVYSLAELVSGADPSDATVLRLIDDRNVSGLAINNEYVVVSTQGILAVYDLDTGELVARPELEIDTPPFAVLSPDGRSVIYADAEYVLRRLILDPEDLVQQARQRVTRELTPDECSTYLGPNRCPTPET